MNKIHVLCLIYQFKQTNPSNLPVGKLSIFSVTNILDIAINRIMDQVKLPMELIKWSLLNLTQTINIYVPTEQAILHKIQLIIWQMELYTLSQQR